MMNKFIFILILFVGFSFGATQSTGETQAQHYDSLNKEGEVIIAAHGKQKDKPPLRKRFYKRKRRVRNPAQGK
mgnify:CR=1 FL=1